MSRQIVSVWGFLLFDRAEILEQIWTIWDGISNHFDQTWFNIIQQGSKNLIQSKIERIGLISGQHKNMQRLCQPTHFPTYVFRLHGRPFKALLLEI